MFLELLEIYLLHCEQLKLISIATIHCTSSFRGRSEARLPLDLSRGHSPLKQRLSTRRLGRKG